MTSMKQPLIFYWNWERQSGGESTGASVLDNPGLTGMWHLVWPNVKPNVSPTWTARRYSRQYMTVSTCLALFHTCHRLHWSGLRFDSQSAMSNTSAAFPADKLPPRESTTILHDHLCSPVILVFFYPAKNIMQNCIRHVGRQWYHKSWVCDSLSFSTIVGQASIPKQRSSKKMPTISRLLQHNCHGNNWRMCMASTGKHSKWRPMCS